VKSVKSVAQKLPDTERFRAIVGQNIFFCAFSRLVLSGILSLKPYPCCKAGGFQRKGAKMQRRKEEVGLAKPGHQTVSIGLGAIFALFLCVFASLRRCVKFLLHGYG
jgi:hypothetical protein